MDDDKKTLYGMNEEERKSAAKQLQETIANEQYKRADLTDPWKKAFEQRENNKADREYEKITEENHKRAKEEREKYLKAAKKKSSNVPKLEHNPRKKNFNTKAIAISLVLAGTLLVGGTLGYAFGKGGGKNPNPTTETSQSTDYTATSPDIEIDEETRNKVDELYRQYYNSMAELKVQRVEDGFGHTMNEYDVLSMSKIIVAAGEDGRIAWYAASRVVQTGDEIRVLSDILRNIATSDVFVNNLDRSCSFLTYDNLMGAFNELGYYGENIDEVLEKYNSNERDNLYRQAEETKSHGRGMN